MRPILNMGKVAVHIVKLTNALRKKHNLPPLTLDPILSKAAALQSEHMAYKGVLTHTGGKYRTPPARVKASCPRENPKCMDDYKEKQRGPGAYLSCCGENVIESFPANMNGVPYRKARDEKGAYKIWTRTITWYREKELAQEMVYRWMHSASHRKNILTRPYVRIGVAVRWGKGKRYYGTQVFAPLRTSNSAKGKSNSN